ncbi:EAL domain-containing protein [Sulfurovum sp.]|nr:EAL domain-containing protein [Sulfurovum sp.]
MFEKIIQLKTVLPIDYKMVSSLNALSEKSLFVVIILGIITSYFLYPALGFKIILWNILLLAVVSYRLFSAVSFRKNHKKYSLRTWYRKFAISAFLTAALFGALAFIVIPYDDNIQLHLFVIIILLGLSGGSSTALAPDHRIAITYVMIIMLPLFVSMLIRGTGLHLIMAMLIIIYTISKAMMAIQDFKQRRKISQQEKQILTVKKALQEKQDMLYHFVEEAPLAIFSYDMDLHIIDTNDALLKLLKTTKKKIIGLDLMTLPDTRVVDTMKKALHQGSQVYRGPYNSVQGLDLWVEIICFAVNDAEGNVIGGTGIIEDKTKEHTALAELEFLAKHDLLTSLFNRRGLKEYMESFMQKEQHKHSYSLLFYLDLNKFKHINDSLGHKAGDELLVAIADRLKKFVKKECIVSRFGGDEFILVSPFVSENLLETQIEAQDCIKRIQKAFSSPFVVDDMNLSMQTSIGIVAIEPNNSDIEEIIRHADIAMYLAKKSGNTHTSYYNTELDNERKKLFLLQHDLVNAAENGQLQLYLQPMVSMEHENLVAAECLLRWNHPVHGLLSPNEFIPIAIETGLISELTWWLVEEICKLIYQLKKKNIWKVNYVSINIDAKQLLVSHFVKEFLSKLGKYDLKTSDILIEITERSIIDNFDDTQDVINTLRNKGIKCAIDDFGTGYSSLSYLKKLSFDTLKIDREFVKDIQNRPDDIALIKMILAIGKLFNYHIVVEGIEEEKQKELLLQVDKDLIYQGFLFSEPLSAKAFTEKYLQNS